MKSIKEKHEELLEEGYSFGVEKPEDWEIEDLWEQLIKDEE